MANTHNVSENTFGNNVVVIQGDNNAPFNIESKGPFLYKSFRWILDHEDFNRWRNTEKSGVFWIKGDPGKGKTMLLGGLIDNFEENPGNINLTYFFCQATDSRINTAAAIIGGLIVSFIKQHQELRPYIYENYKDDLDKLNGPDRWYILCELFEKITQHPTLPHPVCVVDALDECEQEHGCKQLLRLIIKTSCHVKWLISSRNMTGIERELQAIDSSRRLSLELKENAEYVTKSVDLYIGDSIQNIMALKGDEELQIRASDTLKGKANGTFLWVALVVEQLRETKHRNVKKVLEEMPEGLENLYNLILQRLAKQEDKDVYQTLFSTVTAAKRPLRLEELRIFISSQWKNDEEIDDLRDIQDIVRDCGSFLSIQDNTVYFIHQSVKDYMMGTASKIIFPSGIEYQHYKMFTTSLSAMRHILKYNIYGLKDPASDTATISPPDPDPLAPIAYCCIFWVEHLFQSCESGASRDKIFLKDGGKLHSFLEDKYLCWLESLALLRSLKPQGVDAIQKLKNLLSGHRKSKTNTHNEDEMRNRRRKGQTNRYRFIHRYRDLYLGTYIKYAYAFFNYHDDSHLKAFVNDAYQFIHYCKDYVPKYPLQLYYSAVIFEDTHSAIYTTFQHIIRAEFKNTPTIIKMPQRQFSLVQTIKLNCRGSIAALLYSPDSSFLCSLSQGGSISLCRTNTYTLESVIELDLNENYEKRFSRVRQPHFLAFSINSKHLVCISSTGIVQVWAVDSGTQMQNFPLDLNTNLVPRPERFGSGAEKILQEEVIALSYYGDLAASTYRTLSGTVSSVKIWTIENGECIRVIDQSHMPDVFHAAFSPNLAMIALIDKKDARVYSVQTGKEIKHISSPAHTASSDIRSENMMHSRFSSDSKLLALKYNRVDICLWCTETWTMIRHIRSKYPSGHFDLSPNAAISVCSFRNSLILKGMDKGEFLLNIKSLDYAEGPIFSPDWTDSSLLASFSNDSVQIWRAYIHTRNKSSEMHKTASFVNYVIISPKSKFVAAWDDKGNIEIWSGESGECIQVLKANASTWPFPRLVFSPKMELMACVQGDEGDIQIWRVETWKLLHTLKGPGAGCSISHVAFSDDSRYIVVGYLVGRAKVWCIESGKCLYEKKRFADNLRILKVAFSPGSKYIMLAMERPTDSRTMTVCVWDWRTGHCISQTELERESYFDRPTFSSDATVLLIIHEPTSSSPSYKARFYDITSSACLGHIDIGESNGLPFFDPEKEHIISDCFKFCKRSSWRHWDIIPEPGYSYLSPKQKSDADDN
ncbi:hypothetical protein ACSS6W_001518 [Trichoderma asperelloides]